MEKINFNGKEFKIKQSIGSFIKFEEISKKKIHDLSDSLTDTIIFLYSLLYCNNKNTFDYDYDEFVELLDDNENILTDFTSYLSEVKNENQTTDTKKKITE